MRKNIGIVSEGPTDYILLKEVIDKITGENNQYVKLQPEDNLKGEYGNGWKGVWKWSIDTAPILEKIMKEIVPQIDLLIIQMDGDVSRKEKEVHCFCENTKCLLKEKYSPLECDEIKNRKCPINLPCSTHQVGVQGYVEHLTQLIFSWINKTEEICIVIPCDSTDAWIVAAYDKFSNSEQIPEPWLNIISKGKVNDLILVQEALQEKKLAEIASRIASDKTKKFIMIAMLN